VISVSAVLFKNLGVPNADITFYTSWLYLPWVIKAFWGPMVDLLKTRRAWIWSMQLLLGAGLGGVAFAIPAPHFFQVTLMFFWLLAFSSATHDIAADGFYLLALSEHEQSFFSGIRSTFYRVAMICVQGELISVVGNMYDRTGDYVTAWSTAFLIVAGILLGLGAYHYWILPAPEVDRPGGAARSQTFFGEFFRTFGSFFQKPKIVTCILFILLYRLGEAQLVKVVQLFLIDPRQAGGLGLTDGQLGLIYGKIGIVALMLGGLLGGVVAARHGLRFWLWPMLLAIHVPDAVFIWLAYSQPHGLSMIGIGVALEQFGYGFGFTAFLLYLIHIARGEHQTAHYAICTGFMALGMMLPGLWSGWLQERLGYPHFFVWVILATIPSFVVATRIPLDSEFGKRNGPN